MSESVAETGVCWGCGVAWVWGVSPARENGLAPADPELRRNRLLGGEFASSSSAGRVYVSQADEVADNVNGFRTYHLGHLLQIHVLLLRCHLGHSIHSKGETSSRQYDRMPTSSGTYLNAIFCLAALLGDAGTIDCGRWKPAPLESPNDRCACC